jgi:PPOX class probable F420-dependent enzyme
MTNLYSHFEKTFRNHADKDLIESGCHAHLVTLNPDGSPQVTLVWIGLEGDELVAGHLPRNRKVRNIQRDPRVAISLETATKSAMGLTEYAVLYGTARIQAGGAPELLQRLAEVYIGPGVKFPPMDNPPPGYVTRIRVDRIEGVGPWTGRPV